MNDNLSILIKAILDGDESKAGINAQLKTLAAKLDKLQLRVEIDQNILATITKFNESMRQMGVSSGDVNKGFKEQGLTIKDLEAQFGNLGKKQREVIKLNKQLEETGRNLSYKTKAGIQTDVSLDKGGFVDSARIKETTASLGTLIGTYRVLQGEEANEAGLLQTLNQLYGDREVRAHSLNTATGRWTATIAENAKQNRVLRGVLDQSTGALYKQDEALKQVVNRNVGWGEQLKIALSRVPLWMIAMTMFYQSLRFFTNGVKYINELDSALNEIGIVSGKSNQELQKLGVSYQKMAYDMASTTKQIAEASVTFYRQGLNQAEVMDRVRITTMAAKISGLEFAETAELITAATNTMGVSAENAADVFAYLG